MKFQQIMKGHSPIRVAEYEVFKKITLNGRVLDLGGVKNSEYQNLFQGTFETVVVNTDTGTRPDIFHDLEITPLPVDASSYDGVLLINVLEHIFKIENLAKEASRVIKQGGTVVIAVPFLFPIHPSPRDFFRFTDEALNMILAQNNFKNIKSFKLGSGVFSAQNLFIHRLLPNGLRGVYGLISFPIVIFLDRLLTTIARIMRKKYSPEDYVLGYVVTAEKA